MLCCVVIVTWLVCSLEQQSSIAVKECKSGCAVLCCATLMISLRFVNVMLLLLAVARGVKEASFIILPLLWGRS